MTAPLLDQEGQTEEHMDSMIDRGRIEQLISAKRWWVNSSKKQDAPHVVSCREDAAALEALVAWADEAAQSLLIDGGCECAECRVKREAVAARWPGKE